MFKSSLIKARLMNVIDQEIYQISINGLQQRLLTYKFNNFLRADYDKFTRLMTLTQIEDVDILQSILDTIDHKLILNPLGILECDNYDGELTTKLTNINNNTLTIDSLPQIIKCNGCFKFNLSTSLANNKLCKCGYIPI